MNTLTIAVLGDIHCGLNTVYEIVEHLYAISIDVIILVGDYACNSIDIIQNLEIIVKILEVLSKVSNRIFIVWGDSDIELFHRLTHLYGYSRKRALELLKHLNSMNNIIDLSSGEKYEIDGGIYITSNRELVDRRTIYVVHTDISIAMDSLLHIEGHRHYGQIRIPYINAGYVYIDSIDSKGMYWVIEISRRGIERVDVHILSNDIHEYQCPIHKDEGIFYIMRNDICPVCRDILNARFTNNTNLSIESLSKYM